MTYAFELYRDDLGVPHVRAADEEALAYGQGYVTALDRGWQIEADRWRAEGRLAERLGSAGLEWDRFAVQVRLADTARRVHAALPPAEQAWLAAYTAGVNAGLAEARDVPELAALSELEGPLPDHEPWPTWAPVGVFLVAHVLFGGFANVLWRDHVARTLGPAFPEVPAEALAALFAADAGPSSGSNAWAVHGSRTTSGAPLLAGDPHRLLELPGVYQQVRLACDEYDVVGLAFPGVPGVQHFGHTGDAAWGITNAMAHHTEVFAERLRQGVSDVDALPDWSVAWSAADPAPAAGAVEAYGPDGWEPASSGSDVVLVRGDEPVTVRWVETARGPVVAGLAGALPDDPGGDVAYSVRWPVRVDADLGIPSWRALLRARSARDVTDAFAGWVDPVNRVLAADRSEILSLTAGRLVERAPSERVLPAPAWTDAGRARPWVRLPEPVPVTDIAVDANERPATRGAADVTSGGGSSADAPVRGVPSGGWPSGDVPADRRPGRESHAFGWAYAPHRADRIRELLTGAPEGGERPETQRRVHGDSVHRGAPALLAWLDLPAALSPADSVPGAPLARSVVRRMIGSSNYRSRDELPITPEVRGEPGHLASGELAPGVLDAARRLRAWCDAGARMDADSTGAALFAAWRHALVRRVADHPVLTPLRDADDPAARYGAIFAPWFSLTARVGDGLAALLAALYGSLLHTPAADTPAAARPPRAGSSSPSGAGKGNSYLLAGPAVGRLDPRAEAWAALAEVVTAGATDARGRATGVGRRGVTWGEAHRLHPLHVLADVPGAETPGVPAVALAGDSDTVRCTASAPGTTDLSWRGSVARWVWDLSDRDRSRWGVPFGASGDPRSPHFADQLETWADAGTAPVVTDWARLRRVTRVEVAP
ncbi:penicillin acylase family protein [Antribacter gilvus]|uniref:penicillin acylase family protein n=1 Tax=Antribacter gilvus TaxID=2304675 RepID=UPI0013E0117A|nr:penicillin acylase family protein [Antribacter gilvus]